MAIPAAAHPAATEITGRHSRPSSSAAAGDRSSTSRRACGSGIARTTASAGGAVHRRAGADPFHPVPELDRQPLGERGDQAAQPGRCRPADRAGGPGAFPAPAEHGHLRRPRPGQAGRPPPRDDLGELGVADGEVRRAQVDGAPVDPLARHPAADGARPVDDTHRDPRRRQFHGTRDPGYPPTDHDHSHRRCTLGPRTPPPRPDAVRPSGQVGPRSARVGTDWPANVAFGVVRSRPRTSHSRASRTDSRADCPGGRADSRRRHRGAAAS